MKNSLLILVFLTLMSACTSTQKEETAAEATTKLKVFAVNYPLSYFADYIGDEHVEVIYPIPNDVDPAYWEPGESLSDIQSCDVIFANGAGYAKWMDKVSLPSSKVINTSEAFADSYIQLEEGVTHSHGGSGEHVHADYAFTTWLDFKIAVGQAESIKNALVSKMPEQKEVFTANFEQLSSNLIDFDATMVSIGSALQGQALFASHPVYQYLGKAYGLNIISEHWEPGEMPTAAQWSEFQHNLEHNPASIMLWERTPTDEVAASLSELGVTSIVFNPCGNTPDQGEFIRVMEKNIANLKR